jgi:hypothetical protein
MLKNSCRVFAGKRLRQRNRLTFIRKAPYPGKPLFFANIQTSWQGKG